MHAVIRKRLVDLQAQTAAHPSGRALWQAALHTYLSHQYEFGCIGVGRRGYRGWDGMQSALVQARAVESSLEGGPGLFVEDLNADGFSEACQSDGRNLIVTTPLGGRLLYWIDLATGRQLLGNPLAVGRGEHRGDAVLPAVQTCPEVRLADERPYPAEAVVEEAAPTRLGRYLPEWIWEGEAGPYTLAVREMRLADERPCLPVQRRGLVDVFRLDGSPALEAGEFMEMRLEAEALVYRRRLGDGFEVDKVYSLGARSVEVSYRFANAGRRACQLTLETTSEMCLDYAAVLRQGRRALDFAGRDDFPGVVNPLSGEGLYLQADRPWSGTIRREGLLALEIGLVFGMELAPGESQELHLRLALVGETTPQSVSP